MRIVSHFRRAESPRHERGAAGRRQHELAGSALIAALIFAVGVAASAVLADEWRANAPNAVRRSFDSAATDLGRALDSKLDATVALTREMRAVATIEPNAGERRFLQWYRQLESGVPARPDVVAAFIQQVPAPALIAFRRRVELDPALRARLGGGLHVRPAAGRHAYCLLRVIVGRVAASRSYPVSLDFCAPVLAGIGRSPYAALTRMARDTGRFIVTPLRGVPGSLAAIGAAVYRRGAPLTTVHARRTAVAGFIGTTFDSRALIRPLLAGHRSLAIALYHENAGAPLQLIGAAGASRTPGISVRRGLGDGWVAAVSGRPDRSLAADAQGRFVWGAGLLITVLVSLLYLALSRSRWHAWGLVREKTVELEYRELHDPLTELPNSGLILDRAEQLLARARRLDVPVTALCIDIDDFKHLGDRYGAQVADDVLLEVAARLNSIVRESDSVGRLGGDDYIMLVDYVGLDVAPELIAERILDVLRQPFELPSRAGSAISLTASIGIATGLSASAQDLLAEATLALHTAKAAGKDRYARFESAMQTAARDRIHLEMDLASALEAGQFSLDYQPMLSLETEQVVGLEALLRWRHPDRGEISPDVFIPIAEENGLIIPIGRWVLAQACAQGAAWQYDGLAVGIAVNVSARQLDRAEVVEEVRTALESSGLDPGRLTLEITETALMSNPQATARLLSELGALGVRTAVDDFGTGYCSLGYLRQFPVDLLKIDRSFIADMELSSEAHALAHTLIQLGKALGLQTLAEGVTNQAQVRQLRHEGCDLAQGFLFARPLTPEQVERLLPRRVAGPGA